MRLSPFDRAIKNQSKYTKRNKLILDFLNKWMTIFLNAKLQFNSRRGFFSFDFINSHMGLSKRKCKIENHVKRYIFLFEKLDDLSKIMFSENQQCISKIFF